MFSLHETTKIHLCRAAFVALCLAPTCAALAWSVAVHLPTYRRSHERAIAVQLGWQAQLAKASSPRPGTTLYEGLDLFDPETRQLLARLPFVEVQTNGTTIVVKLPFPATLNGERLEAFWKLGHDQTITSISRRQLRLEAQNLTLHLPEGDESFTDLKCRVENGQDQARFELTFRRAVAGMKPAEPAELTVVRQRQTTPPGGVFQLVTGPTPLSCSLAAFVWPDVECLGKTGEFQGRILAAEQGGTWKTQLSGRATNIDLDLLISQRFPHKLTGRADAELEQVTIHAGRIETATGTIAAGPGIISRSLIQSAQAHLHLRAPAEASPGAENLVRYERLGVAFQMSQQGLALKGDLPHAKGAMLIDDHRRTLLDEPAVLSQPVVNLARALVPQSDVQVPATRETDRFTRALPVPSVVAPASGQAPVTRARSLRIKTKLQ
jgi:hypothetical protein